MTMSRYPLFALLVAFMSLMWMVVVAAPIPADTPAERHHVWLDDDGGVVAIAVDVVDPSVPDNAWQVIKNLINALPQEDDTDPDEDTMYTSVQDQQWPIA
ncbi:hypothetical protein BC940DRAFT_306976 [Gongronella butleri]|nr:hypothetical protein BC940DRAFT_306976 [Gongronella butleri]